MKPQWASSASKREKGAGLAVHAGAAGWRVEVGEPGGTRRRWEHQAAQGGGRVLLEAVPRSVGDGEGGPVLVYLEVLWEELLRWLISEGKSRRVGKGTGGAGCQGKSPGVRSLPPVQDKVVSGVACSVYLGVIWSETLLLRGAHQANDPASNGSEMEARMD
jgi:hypothetical protein